MKKALLIGLCLLWVMQTASAQTNLHMGLEAGIVRGFLKVPPVDLTSSLFRGEILNSLGPRLGLNLRYQLKSQISLKTGIYYTQKGAATILQPSPFGRGGILLIPGENLNFSFTQIPIMLRFHPLKIRGFYLGMGPYLGMLISHPHKGFENLPSYTPKNTFDLGFGLALGQEFAVHNSNYLALEMSFELGTNDMSNFSDYRISQGSLLPRAFNFGISYFFLPR
ncbi:MAG: outer membrane beta-barrel protein [Bacteroidia bacterium]|nr:outer membrane beta-barrel protein [Bacteroidia bacterium]